MEDIWDNTRLLGTLGYSRDEAVRFSQVLVTWRPEGCVWVCENFATDANLRSWWVLTEPKLRILLTGIIDTMSILFAGPFSGSKYCFMYASMAMEHLTGSPIAKATIESTLKTATKFIGDVVIFHFGPPDTLVSNNATCKVQRSDREDGFEIYKILRKDPAFSDLRVLFISDGYWYLSFRVTLRGRTKSGSGGPLDFSRRTGLMNDDPRCVPMLHNNDMSVEDLQNSRGCRRDVCSWYVTLLCGSRRGSRPD